jgi:lysozyme family protein
MHALWKDYFDLLMEFEGTVFENDPRDPGGATKFGIDQRSHPGVDIASLTKAEAERIYLAEFGASAASRLPAPMSFVYFDAAVNSGESQAARLLQRAMKLKQVDGIVGKKTLANAFEMITRGGAGTLLQRYSAEREMFYMNLAHAQPKKTVFLKGWLRRTRAITAWAAARLNEGGLEQ